MKGVVSGCLKLTREGFITGVNVICTNYRKRSIYISFPVLVKGQVNHLLSTFCFLQIAS